MIRRLHRLRRLLRPVDRYQGVSGVCASRAALISHWRNTSEERNLRNLRIKFDLIRVYSCPFAVDPLSAFIRVHPRLSSSFAVEYSEVWP
jgi:hypothetical protein